MDSQQTKLSQLNLPLWQDIPDMGLYMDQLLTYLNSVLFPLQKDGAPVITSSMINNYVKNSIVKPPVKKLYKRYHIAFLLLVILLKQCFSLAEILQFIQIYSNIEDPNRVARDYNKAITIFQNILMEVLSTGESRNIYFDSPTYEQSLMISVFKTVVFKMNVDKMTGKYDVLSFKD